MVDFNLDTYPIVRNAGDYTMDDYEDPDFEIVEIEDQSEREIVIVIDFLKQLKHDVYWSIGNPDNPECPHCGATMIFYGHDDNGDFPDGEGYWKCPDCDYSVTENDIEDIDPGEYFDD